MKKDSNHLETSVADIVFKAFVVLLILAAVVRSIILFFFILPSRSDNDISKDVSVVQISKPNGIGEPPGTVVGVDTSYLGGTWQINSHPDLPSSRILFDNTQGYGTVFCEALGDVIEVSFNVSAITYYQNAGGEISGLQVYTGSSWQNDGYRIISFSSGSVKQDVLSWLQLNATKTADADTEPSTPTRLDTPVLTWSNNHLSWSAIANASSYTLYKDGEIYAEAIVGESYIPTVNGSYQVMAVGDGTNYSNSELSTAVTVTITEPTTPIQLPAPYVEGTGNYLTWDAVPHAEGYQLYKDGSAFGDVIVITMFTATQTGVYQVQAIGDGVSYSNSPLSNSHSVTIVPQLPAPVITLNDSGYITWSPVNGAISYGVYRDDSLVATLTDSTFLYAPPVTGTYYVVANAEGNTANSSPASNSVVVTSTPSNPAFNEGYEQGFNDGYDVGVGQGLANPLTIFVRPINSFLTTDLFGTISIGDVMQVLLFICLALIFLKMFAGG